MTRALYEAYLKRAPRQSRSRSVVEAILAGAAELLFQQRGEDDLSVQEVADRAGVSIGSLYDYFRDRQSLIAALAAKATEDNRRAFEEVLAQTESLSLEEGVGRIVDFCLAMASNKPAHRALLTVAHAVGMMPTVALSTDAAAASLAEALRKRPDLDLEDADRAAWMLTHTTMGVVHTLIWEDEARWLPADVRGELVSMLCGYLRSQRAAPAS